MAAAFVHGFLLAIGLILPLGVQNVFVFNQGALQKRFIQAVPVIVTAAICDTLLITLAVLGVSLVILGSVWLKTILLGIGVVFLFYMGWNTWKSTPSSSDGQPVVSYSARRQVVFAASVSLLNPHAILDTVAVIGTSSLQYAGVSKSMFALACILVSWLWFTGLALAGRMTGELDKSGRFMQLLNRVSALVMWGAGVYIASTLIRDFVCTC